MNQTKADLLEGEAVNHWHSLTGLRSIFNQTISALREAQAEIERLNSLGRPTVAAGLPDAGVNAAEVALLDDAMFLLRQPGSHPSPSYVQRKLRVGYKTASTILENLERLGFVSPPNSVGVRRMNAGEPKMTTTDAPNAASAQTDPAVESRLGEQAVPVGELPVEVREALNCAESAGLDSPKWLTPQMALNILAAYIRGLTPQAAPTSEREEFEVWYARAIEWGQGNKETAWLAWQARAAHQTPQGAAQPVSLSASPVVPRKSDSHPATVAGKWTGDLDDDCWLERYGMTAHVEKMDRAHWWFAIYSGKFNSPPGYQDLYNAANQETHIRLLTSKQARLAAEHCMELLRPAHERSRVLDDHSRRGKREKRICCCGRAGSAHQ